MLCTSSQGAFLAEEKYIGRNDVNLEFIVRPGCERCCGDAESTPTVIYTRKPPYCTWVVRPRITIHVIRT